jgi:hypothetical protein
MAHWARAHRSAGVAKSPVAAGLRQPRVPPGRRAGGQIAPTALAAVNR